jgi:uncharacterized protein (TIGR03435 family)
VTEAALRGEAHTTGFDLLPRILLRRRRLWRALRRWAGLAALGLERDGEKDAEEKQKHCGGGEQGGLKRWHRTMSIVVPRRRVNCRMIARAPDDCDTIEPPASNVARLSTTIVPLLLTFCVMRPVELNSAQAAAPQAASAPAFDAASIRRREPGDRPPATRMLVTPGRVSFQAVLFRDCLQWAFGVADWQIADGPAWIGRGVRWDIEARAEGAATDVELRQMFRALLAERFGLRASRDARETRVYLLTVAKAGPRLRRAADNAPKSDDWRRSPLFQQSKAGPGSVTIRELTTERVSMRYLTEYLSRQLGAPVLDRTGLEGDFAFALEWQADGPPRDAPGPAGAPPAPRQPGTELFGSAGIEALRDQLGLTLTLTRAPVDMLVIEAVEEAREN